jgi:hypothetical protein
MAHTLYTCIAPTNSKGHRVWLQDLGKKGWQGGTPFTVTYTPTLIIYTRATQATQGKVRAVTSTKGGIIDTTSQRVTRWAQGSTQAHVTITEQTIILEKV